MNATLETTINQMFNAMWVGERNYNLEDDVEREVEEIQQDLKLLDFNDRQLDLFK